MMRCAARSLGERSSVIEATCLTRLSCPPDGGWPLLLLFGTAATRLSRADGRASADQETATHERTVLIKSRA